MSFLVTSLLLLFTINASSQSHPRPNIILIMTDDQGYGDFGFTGNPHVRTPHLDQLANESIQLNNYYVSPVCAPTRSSLLTGRYSLRTGVHDTYNGGAIMATEEITIAELLKDSGYTTGIFGKWHLGDNYPSRPGDQGFEESLIHLSGGMGQVGDITTYFQGDSSYFNPILWHNGKQEKYDGYCTDIFTSEAIRFMDRSKNTPFFCYLSFNAPHTPLQVPQKYLDMYADIDPAKGFMEHYPELDEMSQQDKAAARRVYAMETNIDDNIGKVLGALKEWNLEENTWVIFMTDNGPQQNRYKAGMNGRKGSVYQGGVRVPCLMRYPAEFDHGQNIESNTAHLDILPTIIDLCGIAMPDNRTIDGHSLLPELYGTMSQDNKRSLFFYWNRRYPEKYSNMALHYGKYKLVAHTAYDSAIDKFELYNINADPGERSNLVNNHPEMAQTLKAKMDSIYDELINSPNIKDPPGIIIGNPNENPVILNRNDASGERGIWNQEDVFGYWNVEIEAGIYDIRFRMLSPVNKNGKIILEAGKFIFQKPIEGKGQIFIEMKGVPLQAMKDQVTASLSQGRDKVLPFWIELTRIE